MQVPTAVVSLPAAAAQPPVTPPAQTPSVGPTGNVEGSYKNESIEKIKPANVKFIEANKGELNKILDEGRKKFKSGNSILDALEGVLKDPKNIDEISKLQGLLKDAGKQISRD